MTIQGRQVPGKDVFAKYGINVMSVDDIVYQPLYDYQTYLAAGQSNLTFFTTPASGTKTVADTNMTVSGMLPAPQQFLCIGVGVEFIPGSAPGAGSLTTAAAGRNWTDVNAVAKSGSLLFTVGQKQIILEAPIGKFPMPHGLTGQAAMSDATTAAASLFSEIDYARFGGSLYAIVPSAIPSGQNFAVTMNWPALVPLPSTVAGRIGVNLFGYLLRKAQ